MVWRCRIAEALAVDVRMNHSYSRFLGGGVLFNSISNVDEFISNLNQIYQILFLNQYLTVPVCRIIYCSHFFYMGIYHSEKSITASMT